VVVTYVVVKARKAQLARNCQDYDGTPADFLKIMNNTEFDKLKVHPYPLLILPLPSMLVCLS